MTLRDWTTGQPILGMFVHRHYFGIAFETPFVRSEMLRTTSASTLLEEATDLVFDADGVVRHVLHDTRLG